MLPPNAGERSPLSPSWPRRELTGCTSKTSTVPPAQAPPAAAGPGAPQNVESAPAPEPALTLPRGTRLEVRLNQTIDVKHAYPGERFTGSLVESVMAGNSVAVPAGSPLPVRFWLPTGEESSKESR